MLKYCKIQETKTLENTVDQNIRNFRRNIKKYRRLKHCKLQETKPLKSKLNIINTGDQNIKKIKETRILKHTGEQNILKYRRLKHFKILETQTLKIQKTKIL